MNTAKAATAIRFSFEELVIDPDQIKRPLGYDSEALPEPFAGYLKEVKQGCKELTDIGGCYQILTR